MANDFNPNLNIDNPLAEIIEAENTLREFGAASAAMEFTAEQAEKQTADIVEAEEAHSLTEQEQLLHQRIAELEAQLAKQRASNETGAAQATITSTNVNDDCPEIVDPEEEPVEEPADEESVEEEPADEEPIDWDSFLEDTDIAEASLTPAPITSEPVAPEPAKPQAPMVTLQHHIPREARNPWEPAPEDIITVQVPKASVFTDAAQPWAVAEDAITLPEGIIGNYQIAATRPMLSENTVYVNWRLIPATRSRGFF